MSELEVTIMESIIVCILFSLDFHVPKASEVKNYSVCKTALSWVEIRMEKVGLQPAGPLN